VWRLSRAGEPTTVSATEPPRPDKQLRRRAYVHRARKHLPSAKRAARSSAIQSPHNRPASTKVLCSGGTSNSALVHDVQFIAFGEGEVGEGV
jgi:hypothetical protein